MSEKLRESLSAAIDDEADEFELRRVLDEMQKDPALRHLWERYHMLGRLLRGEHVDAGAQLRERVWAALGEQDADEPEAISGADSGGSSRAASGPWIGRITGMAVAATVAFAIIFGAGSDDEPAPELADAAVSIDGPALQVPQFGTEISPSDLERANAYMIHHVQQQALNQPGVTSFVKLVTFEDQ